MANSSSTATIETKKVCPHCGSKLPDIPVSLCPYCASPLETAADRRRLESVNASRIERVKGHADYEEAVAAQPPESREYHDGARRRWWAVPVLGMGALVLVGSAIPAIQSGGLGLGSVVALLLGLGLVAGSAWLFVTGRSMQEKALAMPLLRRPGLIVDRRSETEIRGWGGRTTYYFKIELEEGVVGEFRFPGLGAQEDPYATNLPGVAYTRGTDLLHFRHIRV